MSLQMFCIMGTSFACHIELATYAFTLLGYKHRFSRRMTKAFLASAVMRAFLW